MVYVPTLYIKVSVNCDHIIKYMWFNHYRNAYKAYVLFLLLSSLITKKLLQYSIDITTEQAIGTCMELPYALYGFTKMHHYVWF